MHVSVKLFAAAKQLAGAESVAVELPADASIRDLRQALVEQCPPLAEILRHARLAMNNEYASDVAPIAPGAELAVIPPVSGG